VPKKLTLQLNMSAPRFIYHIADLIEWEKQKESIVYTSYSLDDEGFIHCSKLEQIPSTLKRFFKNRSDLVILKIDTTLIRVPVIYEAADDGSGFFPHVFGAIAIASVVEVYNYPFDFLSPDPQKAD
jgi:uncharacterized protein (DUF952 family)